MWLVRASGKDGDEPKIALNVSFRLKYSTTLSIFCDVYKGYIFMYMKNYLQILFR